MSDLHLTWKIIACFSFAQLIYILYGLSYLAKKHYNNWQPLSDHLTGFLLFMNVHSYRFTATHDNKRKSFEVSHVVWINCFDCFPESVIPNSIGCSLLLVYIIGFFLFCSTLYNSHIWFSQQALQLQTKYHIRFIQVDLMLFVLSLFASFCWSTNIWKTT